MSGPVALIIGAGDHIGAAVAKRFAAGGFTVCLSRRRGDALAPLIAEIEENGGTAFGYGSDARDEDAIGKLFADVIRQAGPIDLVIFNVGGNVRFNIRDTTARVFRKVWEMACFAGFLSGREAARHMVPRGSGKIFFTGATASLRGNRGYAAFAAGKAGLRAMTRALAKEVGPQGIHVAHLVIDAGVDTPFVRERIRAAGHDPDTVPPNTLMRPDSVAQAYWMLYQQTPDGWTHELDLRPHAEKWQ